MSIELTILGCHSATPRVNAHPTAQYLEINSRHFLIDCGEGTQRQMRKYKVGFSKINHIFISHLHGDHFFWFNRPHLYFWNLKQGKRITCFWTKRD